MAIKFGMQGRIYRNTGTYAAPVWNEIQNVRDVTLNMETAIADVTTRGNNSWRAEAGTLKTASIEFDMIWDDTNDDVVAVQAAFLAGGTLDLAVLDGPVATSGSQGLRAVCMVTNFSRKEPLEEAMSTSVTVKPTYSANPPYWLVVP